MRSFLKIKPSRKCKITQSLTDVPKLCPIHEFLTWQIYLLRLFVKIKFSRKLSEFTVSHKLFVCVDALHPSKIFRSCRDDFLSSWVEPVLSKRIKCLAQGHTSDSGESQTSNPSIPCLMPYQLSEPLGSASYSLETWHSKTCRKWTLKKRQKLVFKTNYRLMQVKSIAECSKRAFCNTFNLH